MNSLLLDSIAPPVSAALYVAATALLYRSTSGSARRGRGLAIGLILAAAVLHAVIQFNTWLARPASEIDLPTVLSLCALVVVLLLVLSLAGKNAVLESGLIALPIAAAAVLLNWLTVPPVIEEGLGLGDATPGVTVHIVSSVLAFGMLSLAGVYALFVALIDRVLKRHVLSPFVQNLPPLDLLEDLLFRLTTTGFVLLTIALASGLIYVNDLMAQHLAHKTILSILAWVVFGVLLTGRWLKGWRGAVAVRLTLAGFALLLLSYFGSKLVLEVILGRSWHL